MSSRDLKIISNSIMFLADFKYKNFCNRIGEKLLTLGCVSSNSTLIQDSMSELTMYKEDVQTKLAPYTQEAAERFSTDMQKMTTRLHDHMTSARDQMTKYSSELQTMMEQNADDVRARVATYTRKLKKRLMKDTEEIKR